jgi:hypothetical protein
VIRTQIQLTEKQMSTLKELAHVRGISVAALIRESIDRLVQSPEVTSREERIQRALSMIGKYHSGRPEQNVSENHDDYLTEIYGEW